MSDEAAKGRSTQPRPSVERVATKAPAANKDTASKDTANKDSVPVKDQPEAKNKAPARTPTTTRDPLLGQKLQDYVLEERIGVGGMGVVYRAVHSLIAKRVAIKVLRADVVKDGRDIDRLLEEAKTVSSINHRGIINIFGAGMLEDGRRYLVMELLEGESLEAKMLREGQIASAEAVTILEEVLSALAAAHSANVVHRDLKPANVFLAKESGKTYVKLLDFGLARRSQADVTRIAGTPDYISPEHARGRPAGPPADLYGFGVLCFTMLTGQLPFAGKTPMEVMEKHVHSPPPVPHEVNPTIPKALSELILKLLSKEPGQRPEAAQVKADLRAATKQLRNASTAMALDAVDGPQTAEVQTPDEAAENKDTKEVARAADLERQARLADVKRTVKRRWPMVAVGVALIWILGAAVYVLWPSEPDESTSSKPVKRSMPAPGQSTKGDTVNTKGDTVNPAEPGESKIAPRAAQEKPAPSAPGAEVAREAPGEAKSAEPEAPAEAEKRPDPEVEDVNQPLDDFRLGELKRQKRVAEYLDDVKELMRKDEEKRDTFEKRYVKVKKICDDVKTKREFFNCDDALTKLRTDVYKLD
jgi:serine/threonine protein kinase